jgi:hypothetical protein
MAYLPSRILVLGKDGDGEVMRESTAAEEREIVSEFADLEVDANCNMDDGWIQPNLRRTKLAMICYRTSKLT